VDPVTKEIVKAALMIFFMAMKSAGKTPEEMAEIYSSERAEFLQRDPNDLPDV